MFFNLLLKLSTTIRLVSDLCYLAFLLLLLLPLYSALSQLSLGILEKSFYSQLIFNLIMALLFGQMSAFLGFFSAYGIRNKYPGKIIIIFIISLLALLPEILQVLIFSPFAGFFSTKNPVIMLQMTSAIGLYFLFIIIGLAIINSTSKNQINTIACLGGGFASSLFKYLLPVHLKQILALGLFASNIILGFGISYYNNLDLNNYNLAWFFIGPQTLFAQNSQVAIAYILLLIFSIVSAFILIKTFNLDIEKTSQFITSGIKKAVYRKKAKKRKPLKAESKVEAEVKVTAKEELETEVKTEAKEEVETEVKTEAQEEIEPKTEIEIKEETEPEVEIKEAVDTEAKEEEVKLPKKGFKLNLSKLKLKK